MLIDSFFVGEYNGGDYSFLISYRFTETQQTHKKHLQSHRKKLDVNRSISGP